MLASNHDLVHRSEVPWSSKISSRTAGPSGSTSPGRPGGTIRELLEITSYAVSAINLQPWKIKVVSDQETKDKLFPATFGQNQVRACSHLFVFCADTDYAAIIRVVDKSMAAAGVPDPQREAMMEMAANIANGMTPEQRLHWSQEQVYIALGNTLNGAYSLGLGACPMTAFQARRVREDPGPARKPGADRDGRRSATAPSRGCPRCAARWTRFWRSD